MHGRISETTRQNYLDAMGIQTWFPQQILPNALPPREFDFPEKVIAPANLESLNEPQVQGAPVMPAMAASEAKGRLGISLNKDAPTKESPVAVALAPAPVQVSESTPKPVSQTSKFRLVSLSPNEHCLVVAEMPHTGLNQFSRFHQRLLNDILRALSLGGSEDKFDYSEFVWPIGNKGLMEYMSMDDSAAADAVCAYLSNQFGLSRRKVVLLFGQAAARFVIDPQRNFDELRGIQPGLHSEQFFAVTHGLNELMKLSALKAEAWQDLSPLSTFSSK